MWEAAKMWLYLQLSGFVCFGLPIIAALSLACLVKVGVEYRRKRKG